MNIYYIGGSPCCGKTTISEQIAKDHNLTYFPIDESLGRYASMGAEKGYPACKEQWRLSPDETWLRDVRVQCRHELEFYREIFGFIQEDIAALETERDVLVEGAALLPELIKASGIPSNHYICMTPTREFQITHYRKRAWVSLILEGCTDKEKAFENWMERDALFAEEVRRQAANLGYKSILVDGGQSMQENKEQVCACFSLPFCVK